MYFFVQRLLFVICIFYSSFLVADKQDKIKIQSKSPSASIPFSLESSPALDTRSDEWIHGKNPEKISFERQNVLKRKLRQKMRKLHQIKGEIRDLRRQLRSKTSNNNDGQRPLRDESKKKSKKNQKGWRKKLLNELRKLNKLLNDMEWKNKNNNQLEALKVEQGVDRHRNRNQRKKKRQRKRLRKLRNRLQELQAGPEVLDQKKKLASAQNRALQGEQGTGCLMHKECKPGLCCHLIGETNSTDQGKEGRCSKHGLRSGQSCLDSCQCASGLHCYKSGLQSKISPQTQLKGDCKVASAEDITNGGYLNKEKSNFRPDVNF